MERSILSLLLMSERKCRTDAADDKWKCNPCYTVAIHIENKTGFRYHEGKKETGRNDHEENF